MGGDEVGDLGHGLVEVVVDDLGHAQLPGGGGLHLGGGQATLHGLLGITPPPQPLGLLDPAQEISLQLDPQAEAGVGPSAALAVSLEPPGGSPTGLPTGPVIYQGPLLALDD